MLVRKTILRYVLVHVNVLSTLALDQRIIMGCIN